MLSFHFGSPLWFVVVHLVFSYSCDMILKVSIKFSKKCINMLNPQEYADLALLRESPIPYSEFQQHISCKSLKDKGCFELRYSLKDNVTLCVLSTNGNDELYAYEQQRIEHTDNKRQQRFSNRIAVLSVLMPLITFILGLFVEHWTGIAQWFLSLF